MGYLHIDNLYANQKILMFKECYALEKIHGCSAHISWANGRLRFFTNEKNHNEFVKLFDAEALRAKFAEIFPLKNVVIYGEHYGGKIMGWSAIYGDKERFVGFDVKIDGLWLNVPNAHNVCQKCGIEFVDYVRIPTELEAMNTERDKESIQAYRNGMGNGKQREGVILRPLEEMRLNNDDRVIAKYKPTAFSETKTPREINPETIQVLEDAAAIADEWVTPMRFTHVISKLPNATELKHTKIVIEAMTADIYREGKGELVESPEARTAIGRATARMFIDYLKSKS